MAEILFKGGNEIQQAVGWQDMVSMDILRDEILTLIKEKHNCLLACDLEPIFSEISEFFKLEEAEIQENLKNFKGDKK